jgi:hypothetical protein
LDAETDDLATIVVADSTMGGTIYALQSDGYVGTSGDEELDWLVTREIANAVAMRNVSQSLDLVERSRWGRVLTPGERRA